MGNFLTWIVSISVITYAAILAFLYFGQRHMLYMPTQENKSANEVSIRLQSGSETLKIWTVGTGMHALIYFGGNAEDVAWNIPEFKQYFPDHTLYLVNYRGYGGSTGKPTQAGLVEDAINIYDKVNKHHHHISVMGRSLGSLVSVHLAAQREIQKMILITPFDSVLNMAKGMYPVFPVSLLLKDRFDTLEIINKNQAPVLVLVAEQDDIIPRQRTDALINAIPADQVSVQVIEGRSHNDIQNSTDYANALISFINAGIEP